MTTFENLYKHPFTIEISDDTKGFGLTKNRGNEYADTEIEFYINNSTFYLVHLISLLEQLKNAVDLFSNYNYNKKDEIGRGKHLVYNYENYIIRVVSISDRLLQLVNAIFYLGVNEKDVKERSILNNDKIVITQIPSKFKELNKVLNKFKGDRNQIIHRHSYVEKKLKRIEMFYHPEITKNYFESKSQKEIEQLKTVRKFALTDFIKKTKAEFRETNDNCFERIQPILDELHLEYKRIKTTLK